MDTTQDESSGRTDGPDAQLEQLEAADPAEAPDIAERLADAMTVALDEDGAAEPRDDDRKAQR